jgi:plastocyanin
MTKLRVHLLASAMSLVLFVVLAGCGSSSSSSSSATLATATSSSAGGPTAAGGNPRVVTVTISGFAFHPVSLTVPRGTRIKFVNHDSAPHTATANSPGFDSGTLKQGRSTTVSLTKSGSYAYICQFHAFMHGSVTVS